MKKPFENWKCPKTGIEGFIDNLWSSEGFDVHKALERLKAFTQRDKIKLEAGGRYLIKDNDDFIPTFTDCRILEISPFKEYIKIKYAEREKPEWESTKRFYKEWNVIEGLIELKNI